jgi:RHS repeat-associated protein
MVTTGWCSPDNVEWRDQRGLITIFEYEACEDENCNSSGWPEEMPEPCENPGKLSAIGNKNGTNGEIFYISNITHHPEKSDLITKLIKYPNPVDNMNDAASLNYGEITQTNYTFNESKPNSNDWPVMKKTTISSAIPFSDGTESVNSTEITIFDDKGNLIWHLYGSTNKTTGVPVADFYGDYFEYNETTGQIILEVIDADNDSYSFPEGYTRNSTLDPLNYTTMYRYDSMTGLVYTRFPNGREQHIVDINNSENPDIQQVWTYNDVIPGNPFQVLSPVEIITIEGSKPKTKQMVYITVPDASPNGNESYEVISTTNLSFDSLGRVSAVVQEGNDNSSSGSSSITRNGFGEIEREQDASGSLVRYVFDSLGRPSKTFKGLSDVHPFWGLADPWNPTSWQDNMVLSEKRFYSQPEFIPGSPASAPGWKNAGKLIKTRHYSEKSVNQYYQEEGGTWVPMSNNEDELGWYEEFEYDWRMRNVLVQQNWNNGTAFRHTFTWFDNLNREILKAEYGGDIPNPSSNFGDVDPRDLLPGWILSEVDIQNIIYLTPEPLSLTQTIYNSRGLIEETRQYNMEDIIPVKYLSSKTFYNHQDMTLETSNPNSPVERTVYDAKGRVINVSQWAVGYEISRVENVYNDMDKVNKTITWERLHDAEPGVLTLENSVKTYTYNWYDKAGKLIATSNYGTNNDLFSSDSEPVYDPDVVPSPGSLGDALVTCYYYDKAGNVNLTYLPDFSIVKCEYDALGRKVLEIEYGEYQVDDFSAYTITDLGVLGDGSESKALAINNIGQTTGWSFIGPPAPYPEERFHAFQYDDDVMTDIGTLEADDATNSIAFDINETGYIVGRSNYDGGSFWQKHAFVYDGTMIDLGTFGGSDSSASAINNAGQIVGYAYTAGNQIHGALWEYNGVGWDSPIDLGLLPGSTSTFPGDINNAGQIVGYGRINAQVLHAFIYEDNVMSDLNDLIPAGSGWEYLGSATDINESGYIIGWGIPDGGNVGNDNRAFLLTPDPGNPYIITDLGTLPDGGKSGASAINEAMQIAGWSEDANGESRAVIWEFIDEQWEITNLNELISPSDGWVLLQAYDINDAGQIAGYGTNSTGHTNAFLLTPGESPPIYDSKRLTAYCYDQETGQLLKMAAVLPEHEGGISNWSDINWSADDGTLQVTEMIYNGNIIDSKNMALNFDGDNDCVVVSDGNILRSSLLDEFSVSGWFKADNTRNHQSIIDMGNDVDTGWRIFLQDDNLTFTANTDNGGGLPVVNLKSPFISKTIIRSGLEVNLKSKFTDTIFWHHVVVTYNATGEYVGLYLDGKLVDSLQGSSVDLVEYMHGNEMLTFGRMSIVTDDPCWFSGQIRDVSIFNKNLSYDDNFNDNNVSDVIMLYRDPWFSYIPDIPDEAIGYWKLDSTSGNIAIDETSIHNGELINMLGDSDPDWVTGITGNALHFDGIDDYVEIADSPDLNFGISDNFTLEAWIYVEDASLSRGVITKEDLYSGYGIWIKDGRWCFGNGYNTNYNAKIRGSLVKENQWQHVVIIQNGTSGTRAIYVDGAIQGIGKAANSESVYPLYFGYRTRKFEGVIDEVVLYDRCLSPGEISSRYFHPLLIGYWSMNEGIGSVVDNSYNDDFNGVVNSASWFGEVISANGGYISEVRYPDKVTGQPSDNDTLMFKYYLDGSVASRIDSKGTINYYIYDEVGRLQETIIDDSYYYEGSAIDAPDSRIRNISYCYTPDGLPLKITTYNNTDGVISQDEYNYDSMHNLIKEYQAHNGLVDGSTPSISYIWEFSDAESGRNFNRLQKISYPGSSREITYNYGYDIPSGDIDDVLCRITSLEDIWKGNVASYEYAGMNRRISTELGDGLITQSFDSGAEIGYSGLDRFGRITDLHFKNDISETIHRYQYMYDRAGNTIYSQVEQFLHDNDRSFIYEYDGLNRLINSRMGKLEFDGTNPNIVPEIDVPLTRFIDWKLDNLGNWANGTAEAGSMSRWDYAETAPLGNYNIHHEVNNANQIINITEKIDQVSTVLDVVYDCSGNMVFDGNYFYQYDGFNHLISIHRGESLLGNDFDNKGRLINSSDLGDLIISYVYDGNGRLITKETELSNEDYYYDGVRRIQEVIDDSIESEYIYGPSYIDEFIGQIDSNDNLFYMLQDVNYNVMAVIDGSDGSLVEQYVYDPYGTIAAIETFPGAPMNHVGHQGLFFDRLDIPDGLPFYENAVGLYYNRNRWYSPTMGRFMQRDPNEAAQPIITALSMNGDFLQILLHMYSLQGQYSSGMNLYQYCGSNPINNRDPSGLIWSLIKDGLIIIGNLVINGEIDWETIIGSMMANDFIYNLYELKDFLKNSISVNLNYYYIMIKNACTSAVRAIGSGIRAFGRALIYTGRVFYSAGLRLLQILAESSPAILRSLRLIFSVISAATPYILAIGLIIAIGYGGFKLGQLLAEWAWNLGIDLWNTRWAYAQTRAGRIAGSALGAAANYRDTVNDFIDEIYADLGM